MIIRPVRGHDAIDHQPLHCKTVDSWFFGDILDEPLALTSGPSPQRDEGREVVRFG
jgi:hypothetical protein